MDIWPAFELGLWNAWWLMLLYVVLPPLSGALFKDRMEGMDQIGEESPLLKATKVPWMGSMFGGLAYSFFVPLALGTHWLYVGLAVYITGHLMFAGALRGIVAAPPGGLFTAGAYRYSRHPIYIGHTLVYLGVAIASLSWVFLVLALAVLGVASIWVPHEERYCVEKHGEAYQKYMERTPRWVGPPR